jgi:predicted PurR-regulated permease PerM
MHLCKPSHLEVIRITSLRIWSGDNLKVDAPSKFSRTQDSKQTSDDLQSAEYDSQRLHGPFVTPQSALPPPSERSTSTKKAANIPLLILAALALYFCYIIARPFLTPIFAAIVIAVVLYPMYGLIRSLMSRPNIAATLSTMLALFLVVAPAILVGLSVSGELHNFYQSLNDKSVVRGGLNPYLTHLAERLFNLAGRYIDLSRFDIRATLLNSLQQVSTYLLSVGTALVTNVVSFTFDTLIVFVTLFFFFREGAVIRKRVTALLPLNADQVEKLLTRIHDAIIANVYGALAVGLAQGSMTGLAFWVLGMSSPVLWGLITAMASLIPMVGSSLVWAPASIILLALGHWGKALILFGWGAAVVAQVDVLVRPYVVRERVKAHTLLVFFALLGGMKAFGILGLFVGPIVLSITMAVLDMLREHRDEIFDDQI